MPSRVVGPPVPLPGVLELLADPAVELSVAVKVPTRVVTGDSNCPPLLPVALPVKPVSVPVSVDSGFHVLVVPPNIEVSELNGVPLRAEVSELNGVPLRAEVSEPNGVPLNSELRLDNGEPPSSVDSEPKRAAAEA